MEPFETQSSNQFNDINSLQSSNVQVPVHALALELSNSESSSSLSNNADHISNLESKDEAELLPNATFIEHSFKKPTDKEIFNSNSGNEAFDESADLTTSKDIMSYSQPKKDSLINGSNAIKISDDRPTSTGSTIDRLNDSPPNKACNHVPSIEYDSVNQKITPSPAVENAEIFDHKLTKQSSLEGNDIPLRTCNEVLDNPADSDHDINISTKSNIPNNEINPVSDINQELIYANESLSINQENFNDASSVSLKDEKELCISEDDVLCEVKNVDDSKPFSQCEAESSSLERTEEPLSLLSKTSSQSRGNNTLDANSSLSNIESLSTNCKSNDESLEAPTESIESDPQFLNIQIKEDVEAKTSNNSECLQQSEDQVEIDEPRNISFDRQDIEVNSCNFSTPNELNGKSDENSLCCEASPIKKSLLFTSNCEDNTNYNAEVADDAEMQDDKSLYAASVDSSEQPVHSKSEYIHSVNEAASSGHAEDANLISINSDENNCIEDDANDNTMSIANNDINRDNTLLNSEIGCEEQKEEEAHCQVIDKNPSSIKPHEKEEPIILMNNPEIMDSKEALNVNGNDPNLLVSIESCATNDAALSDRDLILPEINNLEDDQICLKDETSAACVMQRVVEGTLQPLYVNNIDANGSIKDPAIFAGVSQEMKRHHSDESDENVLEGILANNVVADPEKSIQELALEADVSHQLTDLTLPSLVNLEHNPLSPPSDSPPNKRIKLDEQDDSSHNVIEGRPTILKVMPLKNGTGLWDIEDLQFALGERGSVLLRICAAPEAGDEGLVDCPYADFTALMLEETYDLQDMPASTSDYDQEMSLFKNSVPISEHSFNSALSNGISHHQPVEEDSFPHLDSADSLAEFISEWPENIIKRKSVAPPPPKSIAQTKSTSSLRGRKRGRPPLTKGILNKKTKGKKSADFASFQKPLSPPPSVPPVSDEFKRESAVPNPEASVAATQLTNKSVPSSSKEGVPITEFNFVKANHIYNRKLVKKIKVQCGFCPTSVRHKYALINHMRAKHSDETRCPICKIDIEDSGNCDMKFHILKVHKTDKLYRCNKCPDSFRTERLIANHKMFVHNEGIVYPQQPNSSSESDNDSVYKRLRSHAGENDKEKTIENESVCSTPDMLLDESLIEDESEFKGDTVLQSSASKGSITSQISRNTRSQATQNANDKTDDKVDSGSESGNESDIENSSNSEHENEEAKRYFCSICSLGFSHLFKLRHHEKTHQNDDVAAPDQDEAQNISLVCQKCGKKCRNTYQLRLHRLEHEYIQKKTTRQSIINTNLKTTSRNSNLIYRAVNNTPPHKSDEESQSESKKSERPPYIVRKGRVFVCTKCNVNFKREKQMTYHLKKIHETLYPFRACPDCGRIFRSCGPYMRHITQHKVNHCPVEGCKARYRNMRLIRKHQRISHSEFPYRCHRCVNLYAKEAQLMQHLRNDHEYSEKKDKNSTAIVSKKENNKNKVKESQPAKARGEESRPVKTKGEESRPVKTKGEESRPVKTKGEKSPPRKITRSQDKLLTPTIPELKGKRMSLELRRLRLSPVSYKEDDDEDVYDDIFLTSKVDQSLPNFRSKLRKASSNVNYVEKAPSKEPAKPGRPTSLPKNISSSVKYSSSIHNSLNSRKIPKKPLMALRTKAASSIKVKNMLSVHRKKIFFKKKNIDTSWTAALKAQYKDNMAKMKQAQKEAKERKAMIKLQKKSMDASLAPAITADVVRRVAESLLSRQQNLSSDSLVASDGYSSPPPQGISSTSNPLSVEDSSNSFEDSSHNDNNIEYHPASSPPSARLAARRNVPEVEDGGPHGVIRFDYF